MCSNLGSKIDENFWSFIAIAVSEKNINWKGRAISSVPDGQIADCLFLQHRGIDNWRDASL